MAFLTCPIEDDSGTNVAQWQRMSLAQNPDKVFPGLAVSVVNGLTVRLSAGKANVGGFYFENTANYDLTTDPPPGSGTRIDRFVLRLTFTTDASIEAGARIDIVPMILKGTAGGSGPALTSSLGPGTYDVPVARWAVVGSSATIQNITNDGPGRCQSVWARDAISFRSGEDFGIPDLYGWRVAAYQSGPEPASVSGMDFAIVTPGSYVARYRVQLWEAAAALAAAEKPYIRLRVPDGDAIAGFQLGLKAPANYGLATIVEPFVVNTASLSAPFNVEPRIFQATGANQNIDFRFKLQRLAE